MGEEVAPISHPYGRGGDARRLLSPATNENQPPAWWDGSGNSAFADERE